MKEYLSSKGGRHLYSSDIKNLQELALSMQEIFKGGNGNFVISGCRCTSYSIKNHTGDYSDGYVYIDGKIRYVEAKKGLSFDSLKIVARERDGESIPYADGTYHPQYKEYYAEYENTDNTSSPFILAKIKYIPSTFPSMGEVFFDYYTASKLSETPTLPSLKVQKTVQASTGVFDDISVTNSIRIIPSTDSNGSIDGLSLVMGTINLSFKNNGQIKLSGSLNGNLLNVTLFDMSDGGTAVWKNGKFDKLETQQLTLAGTNLSQIVVPVGGIINWAGKLDKIPDNFTLCDGRALKVEEYPDLALLLDGVYNYSSDDKSVVRVPNLRSRFVVGYNSMSLDYFKLGKTGGEAKHKLLESEMPKHTHDVDVYHGAELNESTSSSTSPLYKKTSSSNSVISGNTGVSDLAGNTDKMYYQAVDTYTSTETGGGEAHENRPPYFTLAYIIRIK